MGKGRKKNNRTNKQIKEERSNIVSISKFYELLRLRMENERTVKFTNDDVEISRANICSCVNRQVKLGNEILASRGFLE